MKRSEAEREAEEIMEHIVALESNPFSTHNVAVLGHLYELHRLRDQRLWDELNDYMQDALDWDIARRDEFWSLAIPMQTHYEA